jgi:hypothetical protein
MSIDLGSQELPPIGGFAGVRHTRHLPRRGLPGWALLTGLYGIVVGGMLAFAWSRRLRIELEREKRQGQILLSPLLLAEEQLARVASEREKSELLASVMMPIRGI